jgi:6-phosphogluconolactonase
LKVFAGGAGALSLEANAAPDVDLLSGTYTGAGSKGIHRYAFESETGQITKTRQQVVNSENTDGEEPTFAGLARDEHYLFIANYAVQAVPGGSLAVVSVGKDGVLSLVVEQQTHPASRVKPQRQASSHMHSVVSSPDGRFVHVRDLDNDNGFKLNGSGTTGTRVPVELVWAPQVNKLPGEYRLGDSSKSEFCPPFCPQRSLGSGGKASLHPEHDSERPPIVLPVLWLDGR